jgi:hypothetical protein
VLGSSYLSPDPVFTAIEIFLSEGAESNLLVFLPFELVRTAQDLLPTCGQFRLASDFAAASTIFLRFSILLAWSRDSSVWRATPGLRFSLGPQSVFYP